jgi:hypothetical protein
MSNPQNDARIWFLEEIVSLPLRLDQPLYRNYPGMKLGQLHLVDFFSQKLCVLAAEILRDDAEKSSRKNDWVVTAPAFYHVPSGANLLARRVHELLQQQDFSVLLLEPRLNQQQIAVRNLAEFERSNDYSKNQLQQRIVERQRVQELAQPDALMSQFNNRQILIINDIYVTGTQQYFMQQSLHQFFAGECHWLYIFHVESTLARSHPEIEFQLNNSAISDLDSYAAIVADERTQHTARCLSGLFGEDIENFRHVVSSLSPKAREEIFRLAETEGRYCHPIFSEKMLLLAGENHHM